MVINMKMERLGQGVKYILNEKETNELLEKNEFKIVDRGSSTFIVIDDMPKMILNNIKLAHDETLKALDQCVQEHAKMERGLIGMGDEIGTYQDKIALMQSNMDGYTKELERQGKQSLKKDETIARFRTENKSYIKKIKNLTTELEHQVKVNENLKDQLEGD